MHVVIVGATGRIGRRVTECAVNRGHRVTALVRDPGSLPVRAGLTIVAADVATEHRDWTLPADADVVVFAVGSTGTGSTVVRSEGLANVLDALSSASPPRLVVLSAARVAISPNASLMRRLTLRLFVHKRLRNVFNDMERMESELAQHDDIAWTVVRTPPVRDRDGRGVHAVRAGTEPGYGAVSSSEVAEFLLDAGVDPALRNAAVTLVAAR